MFGVVFVFCFFFFWLIFGIFHILNYVTCDQGKFYSFLLICIHFILLSCLIALARTSGTILNESDREDILNLLLI